MQIRETIGFARAFSAHPSQKKPGIRQVFPVFSVSSGRKMPRAKLLRTANREIFVSGEAPGAGILDMYSEHRQRCLARKDPVCGCRIPNLHALNRRRISFENKWRKGSERKGRGPGKELPDEARHPAGDSSSNPFLHSFIPLPFFVPACRRPAFDARACGV